MRLIDLARVVGGSLTSTDSQQNLLIDGAVVDSRRAYPGSVFVAILGERVDGHEYILAAHKQGAVAAFIERPVTSSPIPTILVSDTVEALGRWAEFHRQSFNIPVLGITGSCGKTTTKAMAGSIMLQMGPCCVTEGNFNSKIGAPLNLLKLRDNHCSAVFEMGAGTIGDIAYLSHMIRPTIGLITMVGPVHVETFGSIDQIAQGKAEIYDGLPADGVAILNLDDPYSSFWQSRIGSRTCYRFALGSIGLDGLVPDFYATDIRMEGGRARYTMMSPLGPIPIELATMSDVYVRNSLGAAAMAFAAGATVPMIQAGLRTFQAVPGRLLIQAGKNGSRLIDDTYNASPASVRAAIDVLAGYTGKRILVFGDMLELGAEEIEMHRLIGAYAASKGLDGLCTYGQLSCAASDAFGHAAIHSERQEDVIRYLEGIMDQTTTILVKGSRGMKMEQIVWALQDDAVHA